jgi:flagellar biosynthesis protein FlgN
MDFQQLHTLLQAERDAVGELADCLEQERQALAELDGPNLETLAAAKQRLLLQMEQLAGERIRLATAAGHDSEHMEAFLASADQDGQLIACWRELLETLRACQHQNRVNGSVIVLGQERLQTALGLLRGQASGPRSTTYQANGRTPTPLDPRALGTA